MEQRADHMDAREVGRNSREAAETLLEMRQARPSPPRLSPSQERSPSLSPITVLLPSPVTDSSSSPMPEPSGYQLRSRNTDVPPPPPTYRCYRPRPQAASGIPHAT
ncbi:hypothetical protein OF83DRAFT_1159282 [Amylostereum chailletii]|nr:hypothetical protein OF83DRAFT_1159282 [Amylostereum chailletii]